MTERPGAAEAAAYYFTYINQVPDGDICRTLERQGADTLAFLRSIPEARAGHRYAEGKWTIREVVGHMNDTERLFAFRAFWFARGFDTPLPSFDQNVALAAAGADAVPWTAHLDEFAAVRAATLSFFRHLPADAWSRSGTASGNPFSVRALAWLAAGHVSHHAAILKDRYLTD
jgi:DinB family protein